MARITFKGNKALLRRIETLKTEVLRDLDIEVEATLQDIRNDARAAVPRDTGFLANSIIAIPEEGKVRVNAHYGPYVEFGTGGSVSIPEGLEEYASQFKGARQDLVHLPPRPYLIPAWHQRSNELIDRLNDASK